MRVESHHSCLRSTRLGVNASWILPIPIVVPGGSKQPPRVALRNLNSPLQATRDPYRIELECDNQDAKSDAAAVAPDPQVAAQLIELVDGLRRGPISERFRQYTDVQQPILEYKNLLLIDRLARVADLLKRTHKAAPVKISRALLNYLVTVPLVHGMRSLSTIIESLTY